MPYLGNQHIVGDSVNNFKVLDDISSFTATFDGSASSVVSTANETIRVPKHRFVHGQRVTYNNGGGSNIGGLSSGTAYYVIYDTAHTIKLATSASNASSLTAINLSGLGGGASHTLNVAFDGVNTKFRITHGNGNRPRFHHATQLSIAINNVIQRPNNSITFTEGYAVEVRDIIVFKVAPTVNDIFFGSLTGETRGTFDITDHKIDRFTADGLTTLYDLSQNVPNNESLLVTLNGVVQHPTTGGVTGSYSIVSGTTNKLQFTTAPASGVDIQIRHLGFVGANSGEVTGFYGRTGNVGLNADDHITIGDITSRNINSSGIITATSFDGPISGGGNLVVGMITATSANFSGDVSIGGTLTYEDVKNVDSVGLGTFRDGVVVNTGTATTALIVEGNARITGIMSVGTGTVVIDETTVKTGTSNLHSVGIEIAGINVLGADTPIGAGSTIYNSGAAVFTGVVTATQFKGDGSELTGVSGFSTALSNDTSSLLNQIFKTSVQHNVAAGTSVTIQSDAGSGNVAFTRLDRIHVSTGSTIHVAAGTTFIMNVLNVFS